MAGLTLCSRPHKQTEISVTVNSIGEKLRKENACNVLRKYFLNQTIAI